MNRIIRSITTLLLISLPAFAAGCSETITGGNATSSPATPEDGKAIEALFDAVTEGDYSAKKLTPLFATGSLPDKQTLQKMSKVALGTGGKPSVSGTTATLQVTVRDYSGKSIGNAEWTFVKEGERWKVKSAPLP